MSKFKVGDTVKVVTPVYLYSGKTGEHGEHFEENYDRSQDRFVNRVGTLQGNHGGENWVHPDIWIVAFPNGDIWTFFDSQLEKLDV